MDRNYYYRILGVRSDATPAQIKAAYNTRIARLSSTDYADEPEYARRKKEQATKAYKVLMGVSPSATKEQKENRFEKLKDKIERKEGFDVDDEPRIKFSLPKINLGKKALNTTADKAKLTVAGTAITILIAVIGLVSSFSDLMADDDYSYETIYDDIYQAEEMLGMFDYYEMLDTSTITDNQANIDWQDGINQYGDELDSYTVDTLWWAGIYEPEEFFSYFTGIADYYDAYDDYDCAVTLINWLGAPTFEEIAGSTNLYNDSLILSMTDYMEYLEEFTYEHY